MPTANGVNQKVFVFQHPPESPPRGLTQCLAAKPATRSPSDGMLINQPLPQQRHSNSNDHVPINGMAAMNTMNGMSGMVPLHTINTMNAMNTMNAINGERKINIFGADLPPLTAPTISTHSVMAKLEKDTKPKLEALTDSQSSSRNVDAPDPVPQPVADAVDSVHVPDPDPVPDAVAVPNPVSDPVPHSDGNLSSNSIPNTKRIRRRDARSQSESPRKLKRSRPNIPRLLTDEEVAAMHSDEDQLVMSHLSHLKHFCGGERVSLQHRFEAMFCDKWCSLELFEEMVDLNNCHDDDGESNNEERDGDVDGDGKNGGNGSRSQTESDGNSKYHRCRECGKKYKYLCNLRSHAKVHTNEFGHVLCCFEFHIDYCSDYLFFLCVFPVFRAHVCEFCQKRFGRKANYEGTFPLMFSIEISFERFDCLNVTV